MNDKLVVDVMIMLPLAPSFWAYIALKASTTGSLTRPASCEKSAVGGRHFHDGLHASFSKWLQLNRENSRLNGIKTEVSANPENGNI